MNAVIETFGAGALLAWIALPVLAASARRGESSDPATHHRALLVALGAAASLFAVPWAHDGIHRLVLSRIPRPAGSIAAGSWVDLGELATKPVASTSVSVLWLVGFAWLLLALLALVRLLLDQRRVARLIRGGVPAPVTWQHMAVSQLSCTPGPRPRLLVSSLTPVPFAAGVFQPVIVLPASFFATGAREGGTNLVPSWAPMVMAHELCHVRRRDALLNAVSGLLLALFHGHPFAARLGRELRLTRELAVDAWVSDSMAPSKVEGAREYARALLDVAQVTHCSKTRAEIAMEDTALAGRIAMLLAAKTRRRVSLFPPLLAGSLVACVATVVPPPKAEGPASSHIEFRFVSETGSGEALPQMSEPGEVHVEREPVVSARSVRRVKVEGPAGARYISIELDDEGSRALSTATKSHVGERLAIVVNEKVAATPRIKAPIEGHAFSVTTRSDAELDALRAAMAGIAP
jgi:beta-lactamase regulating signal transducer with metallopeptidase domain